MSKPTVAVDIDDVLVNTAKPVINFYNKNYDTNLTLDNYYQNNDPSVWGVSNLSKAIDRVHQFLGSSEFLKHQPDQEVVATLDALDSHFELIVVTSRPSIIQEATQQWLKQHFQDVFSNIHFAKYYDLKKSGKDVQSTKGLICEELAVQALVDDHLEHILAAADCGVYGVLFGDYAWNQTKGSLPENVARADSWPEAKDLLLKLNLS